MYWYCLSVGDWVYDDVRGFDLGFGCLFLCCLCGCYDVGCLLLWILCGCSVGDVDCF